MPKRRRITEAQVGLSEPVAFEFAGETFHLRYRAGAISPALVDRVNEAITRPAGAQSEADASSNELLAEFVYRCVRWWDVEEEDGTPTSLSRESVRDIEPDFLLPAFYAIVDDLVPGEANAAPSSSTSS